MKNNKGFTLVELLVTITIMGILLVIAIPAVSNIVASNKDKKVDGYRIALERAAKLYIDENEREEFSHYDGCVTVSYDTLKQANLIKEISDKDIECTYGNTYVVVTKKNKTYKYQASLDCKDKRNGGKEYKDGIDSCSNIIPDSEGPYITVTPDKQTDKWTTIKKAKKIKITLEDSGNVGFHFDKKIEYQWVKGDGAPSGSWQTLNMRNNEQATEVTTTLDKAKYPRIKGDEGLYYLHINPNSIVDIEGNKMDSSVRTKFGPYKFDEKAPECKVEPSGTIHNGWYTSDVTYKLNKEQLSGGPVVDYGSSDTNNKVYNKSNPSKLTNDGKDIKRYGFVKDEAGNEGSCNVSVNRDTKAPSCSLNKKIGGSSGKNYTGNWLSDSVYTSASCNGSSETGQSGCSSTVKLTVTGKTKREDGTQPVKGNYNHWHVYANGKSNLTYFVYDNAGNEKKCSTITTFIDTKAPKIWIQTTTTDAGNEYNSAGFKKNGDDYGTDMRYVKCQDDSSIAGSEISGVKDNEFTADIRPDGTYVPWGGFDSSVTKNLGSLGSGYNKILYIKHNYKSHGEKNSSYRCYDKANNKAQHKFENLSGGYRRAYCVCRAKRSLTNISGSVIGSNKSFAKNAVVIGVDDRCTDSDGNTVHCSCDSDHKGKYGVKASDIYASCSSVKHNR